MKRRAAILGAKGRMRSDWGWIIGRLEAKLKSEGAQWRKELTEMGVI